MNAFRRSIPTEYDGRLFRSKLEADWARAFDVIGLAWQFEERGRYFGDQFYLPDFFLPRSGQYIEVKGVFEPADCRKIRAVLRHLPPRLFVSGPNDDDQTCPDVPLIACTPDGHFYGWERAAADEADFHTFLRRRAVEVTLFLCQRCAGVWFARDDWSWRCQCCGASDGRHHIANSCATPVPGFPNLTWLRDTFGWTARAPRFDVPTP